MTKLLQLKSWLLVLLMTLGVGNLSAETYEIVFKTAKSDSSTDLSSSATVSSIVSSGGGYINAFSNCSKIYVGTAGLKFGTGSAVGVLNFTLNSPYQANIKSIQVVSSKYGSDTGNLKLSVKEGSSNNYTTLNSGFAPASGCTYTYDTPKDITTIKLETTSKRAYVAKIILTTEDPNVAVTGVTVSPTSAALEVGETTTLTPTVAPAGATNKNVSWSTSNSSVATVSSAGLVTAVATGTADITVTTEDGSYTATCAVTVNAARTAVNMTSFAATSTTLIKGSTTTTTVANDQAGWTAAYTYASSNEDVATVSAKGVITAVAKGTARITATLNVDPDDASYKVGATTSMYVDVTVNNPSHTVTFSINGNTDNTDSVEEGESIDFPGTPSDISGHVFRGWVATPIVGTTSTEPTWVNTATATMGTADVTYYAVFAEAEVSVTTKTDNLDRATTGVTGTSYSEWSGKTATSSAVYAGQSAGGYESIQLRTTNSNSGVITTTSGGKVKKVTLNWNSNTSSGRTINVYGKNTAYESASDLYDATKQGTLLGTIVYGTSTQLNVTGDYEYVGLRSSDSALYLSGISIEWETDGTTYSNYCTTVSTLPKAIVTLSADAITMKWGATDKVLTAAASVDDDPIDETITFEPSSPNLTIDGSGNIRCNVPGEYTITASVAATAEHQAGLAICTVTVEKQDVTLTFAEPEVLKMVSDGSYTQTATVSPDAYDGDVTYSISSEDALVDEDTGELLFDTPEAITVTATASATDKYNGNTASYTLYVKTEPTIVVADDEVAYDETFTVDASAIDGGDITVTTDNPAIVDIDGLLITPRAVGSALITVSTAASDTYVAGEETFTLTVTQPTPKTTAKQEAIFTETFDQNNTNKGGNDDDFANGSGTYSSSNNDQTGWSVENAYAALQCLRLGTGSNLGKATTPALGEAGNFTLTFKAAAWNGASESTTLKISISDGASLSQSTVTLKKTAWTAYSISITDATDESKITFEGNAARNGRFFLDEVVVTKAGSESVTLNASGYATFCSQSPLDFTEAEGYTAWQVTDIDDGGSITFEKVSSKIKGGQGLLLRGTASATIEIPSADGETAVTLGDNLFHGTMAPEYFIAGQIYGLSGDKFIKNTAGTIRAGKAYLEVSDVPSSVKTFTFIFDDATTGIQTVERVGRDEVEQIFDLSGRRQSKMQRGINIVNGKKVVVK